MNARQDFAASGRIAALLLAIAMQSAATSSAHDSLLTEPSEVGMSEERLARIDNLMRGYVDRGELAGTVTLVARRGHVVHFAAHGYRSVEGGAAMQTDTIFRIASMTKPITSVALMMLFEEGRFKLDDPVSNWIPEFADAQVAVKAPDGERVASPFKLVPAARPITVRHLLTHTAGLANSYRGMTRDLLREALASGGTPPATVDEAIVRAADVPPQLPPGRCLGIWRCYERRRRAGRTHVRANARRFFPQPHL